MKKILAIMATGLLLASCSGDDDNKTPDDSFYALKEGNLWVYKKYMIERDGMERFIGNTDSVTVAGKETVGGLTYYKLHHKVYGDNGILKKEDDDYRRTNDKGYLVDENNVVIHPGFDVNYEYTRDLNINAVEYGTITYKLGTIKDEVVEGQTYKVYPYTGIINPLPNTIPEGLGEEISYQATLGVVKYKTRFLTAQMFLEDRLVSYKLN